MEQEPAALQLPGCPTSQDMAPQQHPAGQALPCENTFLPPNLHSDRVLLYANRGLKVQHLAGDSSRTPGNISGWAGTKTTLTAHQICTWAWPKPLCFPNPSEEQR